MPKYPKYEYQIFNWATSLPGSWETVVTVRSDGLAALIFPVLDKVYVQSSNPVQTRILKNQKEIRSQS